MADTSNITREDLIAIGYAIYTSLYEKDDEPLQPALFAANCEKAFKEFANCLEK